MLIKSLFSLEINSPANLPNEYFLMLEKEDKYKDLHHKLEKLNLHNQNLIQSMSTIKLTLIQLLDDFIKPSEESFITKIQQAFISMFHNLDNVCSNLQKTIETKISNYQSHIENLNKQYKEKLEQVTHYRRKVEAIKKGPLQTREEKEKLNRNIEKKRQIEIQSHKTESLLIQNYENFHKQTHGYLKTVPHQIIFNLIEGNLQTASRIIETVDAEVPAIRKTFRRESIMSSIISQISDADAFSEGSEEDLNNSNEINIIIEPQSDQILNEDIQRIDMAKNEETIDDQSYSNIRNLRRSKMNNGSLKKSLLRRSSLEGQLKSKIQLIQKVKKILEFETGKTQHKIQSQSQLPLQKAFERVNAPLTHSQKIKQIFDSTKNKFCDPYAKHAKKQQNQQKFAEQTIVKPFHEKSFVLEKEKFKQKHSLKNIEKTEKRQKNHLKNQETLNCPSDQQNFSNKSPNYQDKSASISSELSKKNQDSIHQKSAQLPRAKAVSNINLNSVCKLPKQIGFKAEEKHNIKNSPIRIINEPTSELKHHATLNHLPKHPLGFFEQSKVSQEPLKSSQFCQVQKKKIIQQFFSVPNQKINEHKSSNKKRKETNIVDVEAHTKQKPETDLKYWFSTAFSSQKQKNQKSSDKVSQKSHTQNLKINQQKPACYTARNAKTVLPNKQIDFSIFEKIV